jgi:hypothetical protein
LLQGEQIVPLPKYPTMHFVQFELLEHIWQ